MSTFLSYPTIAAPATVELPKIKGSRFLGYLFPVATKQAAEEQVASIRKEHFQATHHCRLYRVGVSLQQDMFGNRHIAAEKLQASDDGEPGGTASGPMKKVLLASDLYNVLLVVVRYFGGTKLGIGGLVQTYTDASKAVIDKVDIYRQNIEEELEISYAYDSTAQVMHLFDHWHIRIISQKYDAIVAAKVAVNRGVKQEFWEEMKLLLK